MVSALKSFLIAHPDVLSLPLNNLEPACVSLKSSPVLSQIMVISGFVLRSPVGCMGPPLNHLPGPSTQQVIWD